MGADEQLLPILAAIHRTINDTGFPPSQREIARLIGKTSPNTGNSYVKKLRRAGLIETSDGLNRSLRVTATGMKALTEHLV